LQEKIDMNWNKPAMQPNATLCSIYQNPTPKYSQS